MVLRTAIGRRAAAAAGVVLVLAAAACGREPAPPAPPPAAPPAAVDSEAASEAAVEREVLAAYQGYWDAVLAANNPPDENHPGLRQHATGAALESVYDRTQLNRLARRAVRLPPGSVYQHRAEVVSVEGGTATVRDCSVDDGNVIDMDTGEALNSGAVTRLSAGTLVREGGLWKVSYTKVEQTWEGVAGCALP